MQLRSRFEGKVVIVTGAARGMGKATAAAFAREGARVIVNDLRESEAEATAAELRASGGDATAIAADVSRRDDAQRLVRETVARYGTVHVLVNNAGILSRTPLDEIPEAEWD